MTYSVILKYYDYNTSKEIGYYDQTTQQEVGTPSGCDILLNGQGKTVYPAYKTHTLTDASLSIQSTVTDASSGYTFYRIYYSTNGGSSTSSTSSQMLSLTPTDGSVIVIWAYLQPKTYTITYTYKTSSGTETSTTNSYKFNSNNTKLYSRRSNYTLDGKTYTHKAWDFNGTEMAPEALFVMPMENLIVPAVYTEQDIATKHILYCVSNNGKSSSVSTITNLSAGSKVALPTTPATSGNYILQGWSIDGEEFAIGSSYIMPDRDVTAYGIWGSKSFWVYFNTNSGVPMIDPMEVRSETPFTLPRSIPEKSGTVFRSWYLDGSYYLPGDSVTLHRTSNVTATAQYNTTDTGVVTYSMSSSVGAITGADSSFISWTATQAKKNFVYDTPYGSEPTIQVTANNVTFAGWFTSNSISSKQVSPTTMVAATSAHTLYAMFYGSVKLRFNKNGGTWDENPSETYKYLEVAHGYHIVDTQGQSDFPGITNTVNGVVLTPYQWATSSSAGAGQTYENGTECIATYTSSSAPSVTTIDLYPKWPQVVTLKYNDSTGTEEKIIANPMGKYNNLPTPTSSGLDFVGWYDGTSSSANKVDSDTVVTSNSTRTLYGRWETGKIEVTFNPNGGRFTDGSGDPEKRIKYTRGSVYSGFPGVAYSGEPAKTFAGWFDTSAETGGTEYKEGDIVTATEDFTVYARWEVPYVVYYDTNGAAEPSWTEYVTPSQGNSYSISSTVPTKSIPDKQCRFGGWTDGHSSAKYQPTQSCPISGDTTFTATWLIFRNPVTSVTLTYDTDGGSPVPDPVTANPGSKVVLASGVQKQGKIFEYWIVTFSQSPNEGEEVETFSYTIQEGEEFALPSYTDTVTAKAHWYETPVCATYYCDTEKTDFFATEYVIPGNIPQLGETPYRPGYIFKTWSPTREAIYADTDYTAVFEENTNTHTVIWYGHDRIEVLKTEEVQDGKNAVPPAPPRVSNKIFARWDPQEYSCVEEDMTIYAVYEDDPEPPTPGTGNFGARDDYIYITPTPISSGEVEYLHKEPYPRRFGYVTAKEIRYEDPVYLNELAEAFHYAWINITNSYTDNEVYSKKTTTPFAPDRKIDINRLGNGLTINLSGGKISANEAETDLRTYSGQSIFDLLITFTQTESCYKYSQFLMSIFMARELSATSGIIMQWSGGILRAKISEIWAGLIGEDLKNWRIPPPNIWSLPGKGWYEHTHNSDGTEKSPIPIKKDTIEDIFRYAQQIRYFGYTVNEEQTNRNANYVSCEYSTTTYRIVNESSQWNTEILSEAGVIPNRVVPPDPESFSDVPTFEYGSTWFATYKAFNPGYKFRITETSATGTKNGYTRSVGVYLYTISISPFRLITNVNISSTWEPITYHYEYESGTHAYDPVTITLVTDGEQHRWVSYHNTTLAASSIRYDKVTALTFCDCSGPTKRMKYYTTTGDTSSRDLIATTTFFVFVSLSVNNPFVYTDKVVNNFGSAYLSSRNKTVYPFGKSSVMKTCILPWSNITFSGIRNDRCAWTINNIDVLVDTAMAKMGYSDIWGKLKDIPTTPSKIPYFDFSEANVADYLGFGGVPGWWQRDQYLNGQLTVRFDGVLGVYGWQPWPAYGLPSV